MFSLLAPWGGGGLHPWLMTSAYYPERRQMIRITLGRGRLGCRSKRGAELERDHAHRYGYSGRSC